MKLLIDIGNSRIKWWIYDTPFEGASLHSKADKMIADICDAQDVAGRIEQIRVASVAKSELLVAIIQRLLDKIPVSVVTAEVEAERAGLKVAYQNLEMLGVDRWLAMLAAFNVFGASGCVVIDAGSALTADFVTGAGAHKGGLILPGVQTMAKALFANTRGVAVESLTLPQTWQPGCDTLSCVEQGVTAAFRGLLMEIQRYTRASLSGAEVEPAIVVTGGDAEWFVTAFNGKALYEPRLVLKGLMLLDEKQ
ncbi:type III pantothenate kinase [Alteromonadaceae bacterium 2753L.S.0a.02]|nr:type III pantothenate kinase [Alteromonadaceae bacterium 2753L.S.0a.02]